LAKISAKATNVMTLDPTISEQIDAAFESGNIEEFKHLLRSHPEHMRSDDGSEHWMRMAAMAGQLPIIQALVELGIGVNESHDRSDPNDSFYEPEGAILQAAGFGHVELVRWLLEHGAKINYVVQNKPRCWPLIRAAGEGHLEVVKLLVEHGADIHSTWRGLNAITQAENLGQFAVRDYLRTLGARTLRETTPPDYAGAHQRFLKHMTEQRGPLGKWQLEIAGTPLVTVHVVPANKKCDEHTLFTVGLSDRRLPQGQDEFACTELRSMLPANWPVTEKSLKDVKWNWPVEWLKWLVGQLRQADRWPHQPAIFMNGDPPRPLAPNTQLSGWLCLKSLGESVQAPDYRWIDIHSLFPIYTEELALIRKSGHEELVSRFQARNVPLHIEPVRPNMAIIER
jgi:hypothetical protein